VPDAEAFLMEIVSLLKPKGKLLVLSPGSMFQQMLLKRLFEVARRQA